MTEAAPDLIIIGSGLAGLGAARAVAEAGAKALLITDHEDEVEFYTPRQILRALGLGGTSRYWHGVIPTEGADQALQSQVAAFYRAPETIWAGDNLFVPRVPVRTADHFAALPGVAVRPAHVTALAPGPDGFVLTLQDGTDLSAPLSASRVVLAAGVLGTLDLLAGAGLAPAETWIGDHICGFVGMIDRAALEAVLSRPMVADRGPDGYAVPALTSADGRVLFTFRPARLEMRDPVRQNRGGPKFAASKGRILRDLILSGSFGRLAEAVALKTGRGFVTDKYAIHFQAECPQCHRWRAGGHRDGPKDAPKDAALQHAFDRDAVTAHVAGQAQAAFGIETLPVQDYYYGTHLFGAQGLTAPLPDGLVVADATTRPAIGGGHHSFDQMTRAHGAVAAMLSGHG